MRSISIGSIYPSVNGFFRATKKKRNNGFIISNSHLVESGYFTKPRVISPAAVIAQVHC